jgi:hypothetical protein
MDSSCFRFLTMTSHFPGSNAYMIFDDEASHSIGKAISSPKPFLITGPLFHTIKS